VADFERDQRRPIPNNMMAMQNAFEAVGVTFLLDDRRSTGADWLHGCVNKLYE
jgi:hypothetical protein